MSKILWLHLSDAGHDDKILRFMTKSIMIFSSLCIIIKIYFISDRKDSS